jgi:hypothetical protein
MNQNINVSKPCFRFIDASRCIGRLAQVRLNQLAAAAQLLNFRAHLLCLCVDTAGGQSDIRTRASE